MIKHKTGPSLKSHPLSWGVCLIQLFGDRCDSCRLYQHTSSFFSPPSFSVLEERGKCLWNSAGWQQGERELVESWHCPGISYSRGRDTCPALRHPPTQHQNIAQARSQDPTKPTCARGSCQPGNTFGLNFAHAPALWSPHCGGPLQFVLPGWQPALLQQTWEASSVFLAKAF